MNVRIGAALLAAFVSAALCADPSSLVPGDPLACFDRIDGAGAVTPSIADGLVPTQPLPAPVLPLSVWFGDVPSAPCAATSIGLVFPGVTQVNVCVPDGVEWMPAIPISVKTGLPDGRP